MLGSSVLVAGTGEKRAEECGESHGWGDGPAGVAVLEVDGEDGMAGGELDDGGEAEAGALEVGAGAFAQEIREDFEVTPGGEELPGDGNGGGRGEEAEGPEHLRPAEVGGSMRRG